jgi:cell division GTPase FtsZ
LVEIIAMPGIINVDFADVKNIMQDAGIAIVGVGKATGPDRAVKAVNAALHSPLLETSPEGAKAVLLGITGSRDLKMTEVNDAAKIVAQTADPGARIIFGAYYDRTMKPGELKVTIVAAGFNGSQPGALFGGTANHFEGRQSMFSRPGNEGPVNGNGAALINKQSTPMRVSEQGMSSKNPVVHARGEESADEMMAQKSLAPNSSFEKMPSPPSAPMNKPAGKEKESDAWDIPAFLRRRKR